MRRTILVAVFFTAAIGMRPGWAHEDHAHTVMGTVTARDAKHVEVKTPSGDVLSIALNEKTAVVRAKRKVDPAELKVGLRVVVDIGNGEDPLVAKEVQLGVVAGATKQ